jgi:hypothetical protein
VDAASTSPAAGDGVVTQRSFQSTVARLVIDPDFREWVRMHGAMALDSDLTTLEQKRVMAIVSDKGLDAARTLHKSFRLTKIYTLLPLTRALLRPKRLAKEISSFWKAELPVSHYFMDEAIAFCDFLRKRLCSGLRIKYLGEIVAYERANLELRRPRTNGDAPEPQFVKFNHDPVILLPQLMSGKDLRVVPDLSCLLIGSLGPHGEVQWHISIDSN